MSKTYRFIASETTAGDMARTFLIFQFTLPRVIATYALILVFGGVLGFVERSIYAVAVFWVIIAFTLPFSTYLKLKKRFRATVAAPGTITTVSFDDAKMHITTPQSSSDLAYSLYGSVRRQGEFVMLQQNHSAIYVIMPGELFPDDVLDMVSRRIAESSIKPV